MFADATVFALSLYAVGKASSLKKRAAKISGYLQMILALWAFSEVVRRFIYGSEPETKIMIVVAAIALIENLSCMRILAKHRKGEVHMQASWIFLTNDIIANIAVVVAALLVIVTGSHIPDLVTGALIGCIVFTGSIKILKVAKTA
jgi:Co/Zn/Cd efflux system component